MYRAYSSVWGGVRLQQMDLDAVEFSGSKAAIVRYKDYVFVYVDSIVRTGF